MTHETAARSGASIPERVRTALAEIAADRTHGARWLTRRSAEVLLELAEGHRPPSGEAIREAAGEIAAAHPAMASMQRLAWAAGQAGNPAELALLARQTLEQLERAIGRIAGHCASLIPPGGVVLTHSHSGTVEHALLAAQERGIGFSVLLTESLPNGESAALRAVLEKAGIAVTMIPDMTVFRRMPEAGIVLFGADAVSPAGLVNKVGTAMIALAARHHGKPAYGVLSSDKLLMRREPLHDTGMMYDLTPLRLLKGIVTEDGTFTPGELF